ncbi:MAG: putative hydroxylase [Ilumatobacteraceae bacterium]|nr:putative hydroxylase [Ilumatobacteraceae bacterium]
MHAVTEAVAQLADHLTEHAFEAEELGRVPHATVAELKRIGVIRMMQPCNHGGMEAAPADFYETVITASRSCGSTGWVCGIVGVHPWELALTDPRVQDEIWGDDPDRWVASPYAPFGRARPVDGGYVMSGRWPFSTGTDHCEWAFLGGLIVDATGAPPSPRHFLLPRADYEIVPDSWNVIGLKGSGSKDVVVREAFIPDYRTVDPAKLVTGQLASDMGRNEPIYRMPFLEIFCGAIVASVIGICEGALASAIAYMRERVGATGARSIDDPIAMSSIGAAAADIDASHVQFTNDMRRMFDVVDAGASITMDLRADVRRNQVRASRRAVEAVDQLFYRAGGGSLRLDQPFQRFWRDAHAAMHHAVNVADPVYLGWANNLLGLPVAANATI